MRTLLTLLFIATIETLYCQSYSHIEEASSNSFLNDANGRPLYLVSNYTAEGSPFFMEEYQTAQLISVKGAAYNNIKVKLNLVDRVIQYMDTNNKEMVADIAINRLIFTGFAEHPVILQSFTSAINTPGAAIYQVLDTGRVKLLKKIIVNSRDEKRYGNAGITRVFERKETYFFLTKDNQPMKLEKGKAEILSVFADNKETLSSFIEQNNVNCRTEEGIKKVFNFYNSLPVSLN